jgi:hypothetical protein
MLKVKKCEFNKSNIEFFGIYSPDMVSPQTPRKSLPSTIPVPLPPLMKFAVSSV